jgi:DNA-directed RNA polymerase subunit RPC12/RpoP
MIEFQCNKCGQKISIHEIYAGKKGRCPKCKNVLIVPELQNSSCEPEENVPVDNQKGSKFSAYDLSLLDIPQKGEISNEAIGQYSSSDRAAEDLHEPAESAAMEEIEPAGGPKLPWLIDIFLYPLNLAGFIHLICLWLLVFLLCPLVMALLGLGTEYIPFVYTLPVAYVLYYFSECIRDSAAGHCRAPDFWMHPGDDKWHCISQLLVVLGCIAVHFWPVSVYYIFTERTDLIYWLLMAFGGFFFPMALLAVVLFDSLNALNPILIIRSIFRTLLPYCGMVLLFYGGALLFMEIDSPVNRFWLLPILPFILKLAQLYLVFVSVGLLGRFYWRYQDKLNWEV